MVKVATKNPPILVTGSHRSGKGLLIGAINLNDNFNIIQEPLNPKSKIGWTGITVPYYYMYIDDSLKNTYKKELSSTIHDYKYRVFKQLKEIKKPREYLGVLKDILTSCKLRLNWKRLLIDDPFALLSAEWFYFEFGARVIIMIRHPASFVSSLKLLNYEFPFSDLLNQEDLINKKLLKYLPEINEYANNRKSIVEQGALLWRLLYEVVLQYKWEFGSQWLFVRFEDIVRFPEVYLPEIYNYIDLPKKGINFQELKKKYSLSFSRSDREVKLLINQNRIKNNYSVEGHLEIYKSILNKSEIELVKNTTKEIWKQYYSEADWK